MKNTIKLLIIYVLCIFSLAACSSSASTRIITGTESEQIIATAEPIITNLLTALNRADFKAYSKDFDSDMQKASTESSFITLQKLMSDKVGAYKSCTVSQVVEVGEYYRVNYLCEYEKSSSVVVRLVLTKDAEPKVSGTWFNSPN